MEGVGVRGVTEGNRSLRLGSEEFGVRVGDKGLPKGRGWGQGGYRKEPTPTSLTLTITVFRLLQCKRHGSVAGERFPKFKNQSRGTEFR